MTGARIAHTGGQTQTITIQRYIIRANKANARAADEGLGIIDLAVGSGIACGQIITTVVWKTHGESTFNDITN